METVYDLFIKYYSSIADQTNPLVEQGIRSYLNAIAVADESVNAERIASRELRRFKLMPVERFEQFFELYPVRRKVEAIIENSRKYAYRRANDGIVLDETTVEKTMQSFYSEILDMVKKPYYKGWISDAKRELSDNLDYASGQTELIPITVYEMIEANKMGAHL